MSADPRLEALRRLKRLLDEAFHIPGTGIRFGWDALIGLAPGVGDLLTGLMGCAIIIEARRRGVPRVVQLRMLLHLGIDLVAGMLPIVGDVADIFWKSNTKNFALLERHAGGETAPSSGDWAFVVLIVAGVIAMAAAPLVVLYWIGRALV